MIALLALLSAAQADATLTGSYVKIHYNNNGTWNNGSSRGYQVQNGDGVWQDVTYPGSPWMQMTVEYNIGSSSYDYRGNWSGGSFGWSTISTTDLSEGTLNHISHVMNMGSLRITKDEIWEDSSKIVTLAFVVENTSSSTISNFRLIHGYDPDTDYNRYGTFSTYNDRSSDNLYVQAVAPYSNYTVAYGVCDPSKQEVGITGWDSDADAYLRDDGGSSGDNTIHWRHRETSIGPYETVLFSGLAVYGTNAVDARNQYDSLGDEACNGAVCDLDEDGYERPECGGMDCDDEDPWVNPAAIEIPYDGVDNDCDGSDLADVDGDGFDWDGVGGADCDDGDAAVSPDAAEVAYDGIDNDCDGEDLTDADGDGYDWAGVGGDDCADGDETIHPGVDDETPDGTDEDCDGTVDEGTALYDDDGDGYTETAGDCDDDDPSAHPGATEWLDGVDEDCDGIIDEGTDGYDDDGDGYTELEGDCADGDPDISPDADEIWGDGIDNDCDGTVDSGATDVDGDGYSESAGDCDDEDEESHPGAEEIPDLVDNDCDGLVDEDTEYSDDDYDGLSEVEGDCNDDDYGVGPEAPEVPDGVDNDCDGVVDEDTDRSDDDGDGFSEEAGDCDDADAGVHPGASELPDNGVDDDCDEDVDEMPGDIDGDGYTVDDGDCDDGDGWANPGAMEMCDGRDNNCDGVIDEGCEGDSLDGDGALAGDKGGCSTVGRSSQLGLWLIPLAVLYRRRSA